MPRPNKGFNKHEYIERYNKGKTSTITVRLNKNKDKELIAFIQSLSNKSGTIKELVAADMRRQGKIEK